MSARLNCCVAALATIVLMPSAGIAAPVPLSDSKRSAIRVPVEASEKHCLCTLLGPKLRDTRELILHSSESPDRKIFYLKSTAETADDDFNHAKLTDKQFDVLCNIIGDCSDDLRGKDPDDPLLKISLAWDVKGKPGLLVRYINVADVPKFVKAVHTLAKEVSADAANAVRASIVTPVPEKVIIDIDD